MKVRALADVFLGPMGGFRARGEVFSYDGPTNRHLAPVPDVAPAPPVPSVPLSTHRPMSTVEQMLAEQGALTPGLKKVAPLLPPGWSPDSTVTPPRSGNPLDALAAASEAQTAPVRLPPTATPIDGSDLLS
jgi:hypothetical protein